MNKSPLSSHFLLAIKLVLSSESQPNRAVSIILWGNEANSIRTKYTPITELCSNTQLCEYSDSNFGGTLSLNLEISFVSSALKPSGMRAPRKNNSSQCSSGYISLSKQGRGKFLYRKEMEDLHLHDLHLTFKRNRQWILWCRIHH